jgi:acetyl esterase/lipase
MNKQTLFRQIKTCLCRRVSAIRLWSRALELLLFVEMSIPLRKHYTALTVVLAFVLGACDQTQGRTIILEQISSMPATPADHRIHYGNDPLQFGDLRLPKGDGPYPVAVVIHGGCWRSENDLQHISHLSEALTNEGVATWTLEYRRIGNNGGGWPGTFEDVAAGSDYLQTLAKRFPLDLSRVVLVGHSAGGQLALWVAARQNLPQKSPLASAGPLAVRGVVSLAGITDLRTFGVGRGYCNASVAPLLGGTPEKVPDRYAQASPIELLPLRIPERLVHGKLDLIVPVEQSRNFVTQAKAKGDDAQLLLLEDAGHFDLIAPFSPAFATVKQAILSLLKAPALSAS